MRATPLRWLLVVAVAAVVGVACGFAFERLHAARSHARLALPQLHGQGSWPAGSRAAPAVALRDEAGRLVRLAALRGRPVLLTFMDSRCTTECPVQGRQLGALLRRLPARERPTLVIVGVDPRGDTPQSIRRAMTKWTLAGPWRSHWLRGTPTQLERVWREYGVTVDRRSGEIAHSLVLYLIDRQGYERTAYLYPFLPAFVQRDLATLAGEEA